MSLLQAGFGSSGDDYEITDSLRLRSSASAYLARTPLSAGNRRTWTLSWWAKRGALGSTGFTVFSAGTSASDTGELVIKYDNNYPDSLAIQTGSTNIRFTNALYRDPSAWHHVVVAFDTTQGTASNRTKVYVNGAQITSFNISNDLTQNTDTAVNNNVTQEIGVFARLNSQYLDGYLTEVQMIDGQQLDADDFGEYDANGTWKAKEYTGTYGTNGFYLPMKPTTQADGFNTVLYTGDSGTQSISGVGFSPDFVWIKPRNAVGSHILQDTVRGNTKFLESNSTGVEQTNSSTGLLSFDSDGFTVGSGNDWNNSGETFVAWAWDAGSGSAASNTDGSITSTVKANDSYGFSIVSYTGNGTSGATIGHGLSSAPKMIIVKNRTTAGADWPVYHEDTGNTGATYLNTTAAFATDSTRWNNTSPTSTVFSVGNGQGVNHSSASLIAYCFSEVAGYSKIDSYTGNASTTGPVVTTGFRPAWIMTKAATGTGGWHITDTRRYPQNDTSTSMGWLDADSSAAEGDYRTYKVTDTGFQVLDNGSVVNGSGVTYIYMAIADTADAQFNFDASGNHNNFEPFNINSNAESETTYDLMKDTPSLVDENAGNFATWNPLITGTGTFADGNLSVTTAVDKATSGTVLASSGKWYAEIVCTSATTIANARLGIANADGIGTALGANSNTWAYLADARVYHNNSSSSYGTTLAVNDVFQIALDLDAGKVWYGINNTFMASGNPETGANPSQTFTANQEMTFAVASGSGTFTFVANFGQRPFAYTPPTGFLKLNTFNLSDSTIEDGSDYFTPVLYSGNSSTQSITGVGFQPDLVWTKDRNSYVHVTAVDAVRGAPLDLFTSAQNGDSNDHNGLTAFTADGFNLGSSTNHNVTGHSYVAWNWLAGNSTSTNTSGSVNSTVSVNTTAGFSIVGFTSPSSGSFTMGHGLGASPDLIIMKMRETTSNWGIFHSAVCTSEDNYFIFNSNALISYTDYWGTALPTSTVFGANVGASVVANQTNIAWCWRAVEGYSAFGKYTGNGNADGTFVYTGFRPAYILVKSSSGASNNIQWNVYDTTRGTFNPIDEYTLVSTPDVESDSASTYYKADILSNGFKLRASGVYGVNQNNCVYAYAAFAENPFKNANAR